MLQNIALLTHHRTSIHLPVTMYSISYQMSVVTQHCNERLQVKKNTNCLVVYLIRIPVLKISVWKCWVLLTYVTAKSWEWFQMMFPIPMFHAYTHRCCEIKSFLYTVQYGITFIRIFCPFSIWHHNDSSLVRYNCVEESSLCYPCSRRWEQVVQIIQGLHVLLWFLHIFGCPAIILALVTLLEEWTIMNCIVEYRQRIHSNGRK